MVRKLISQDKKTRKQESKEAGKILKSKFKRKFGYWFVALGYFIKNNLKFHSKKIGWLLGIISIFLLLCSIYELFSASHENHIAEKYHKKNSPLEQQVDDLQSTLDKQESKINDFNIASTSGGVRGVKTLTDIFNGMYNYDDGKEYDKNRKDNLNLIKNPKQTWVKKLYSDNKDKGGENIIDNLNMKSSLNETYFYTKNADEADHDQINFLSNISYQSYSAGASQDSATRTHQSIYNVKYDTKSNKIIKMDKVNTVKSINNVE